MPKSLNDIGNEKDSLLLKIEKRFVKKVERLQRRFYESVRDYFSTELIIEDTSIKAVTANYIKVNNVGFIHDSFKKQQTKGLVDWMVKQYLDIATSNKRYFTKGWAYRSSINTTVRNKILLSLGLKVKDSKARLIKGGFLDSIDNFDDAYIKVKEIGINAVAEGIPFENFKKNLIKEVARGKGFGSVKHHLLSHAKESFSDFNGGITKEYADKLGIDTFRWSGGIIKTTRDFPCREYNGLILTEKELREIEKRDWSGKWPRVGFDILKHAGGIQCRHTIRPVPKRLAIKERPELEDIL